MFASLALLSSTHPQLLSRSRIPLATTPRQLIRYWLFTLKLPSMDESLWSNVLKDHINAKVAFNSCIGDIYYKRLKQKDQWCAGTDHYSMTPFLQNCTIQTEASTTFRWHGRQRTKPCHTTPTTLSTATVSHIIQVECTLDLMELFWPSNSLVGLILWGKTEHPPAQFKNQPVESYFF